MSMFITFEGPDGSGKSTLIDGVYNYFKNRGEDVILTREPGGIEISERIRQLVLDPIHDTMDNRTEALLYAASRRQHLIEKVKPALAENKMVLCDRFVDSSLAYQGYARDIGIDEVLEINNFAIENMFPDLTIFLEIDPMKSLSRLNKRGNLDRLEQEKEDFHNKVYKGYKIIVDRFSDRIKCVNADQSPEKVLEDTIKVIESYLNEVA